MEVALRNPCRVEWSGLHLLLRAATKSASVILRIRCQKSLHCFYKFNLDILSQNATLSPDHETGWQASVSSESGRHCRLAGPRNTRKCQTSVEPDNFQLVLILSKLFFKMYRPIIRSTARQLAFAARPAAVRGYAEHATPQPFDWQDPLNAKSLFTEDEIAISETAEAYCQERMLPRVLRWFNGPFKF